MNGVGSSFSGGNAKPIKLKHETISDKKQPPQNLKEQNLKEALFYEQKKLDITIITDSSNIEDPQTTEINQAITNGDLSKIKNIVKKCKPENKYKLMTKLYNIQKSLESNSSASNEIKEYLKKLVMPYKILHEDGGIAPRDPRDPDNFIKPLYENAKGKDSLFQNPDFLPKDMRRIIFPISGAPYNLSSKDFTWYDDQEDDKTIETGYINSFDKEKNNPNNQLHYIIYKRFQQTTETQENGKKDIVITFSGNAGTADVKKYIVKNEYKDKLISSCSRRNEGYSTRGLEGLLVSELGTDLDALNYFLAMAKKTTGNIYIHGYSLGGGIAMSVLAAVYKLCEQGYLDSSILNRIKEVKLDRTFTVFEQSGYEIAKRYVKTKIPLLTKVSTIVGGISKEYLKNNWPKPSLAQTEINNDLGGLFKQDRFNNEEKLKVFGKLKRATPPKIPTPEFKFVFAKEDLLMGRVKELKTSDGKKIEINHMGLKNIEALDGPLTKAKYDELCKNGVIVLKDGGHLEALM